MRARAGRAYLIDLLAFFDEELLDGGFLCAFAEVGEFDLNY